MRIPFLILLLVLSWTATAQTVWKYVDEQGITHYTDQPVPGAQKVQLRSGNTTAAAPATATATARAATVSQQAYRLFQITSPANQESVVNTGGLLQVSMQLDPPVMTGHTVALYLDGKLVEGFAANSLQYELPNVPRGDHTLLGVITDENDRRVGETNKVTFTMRQNSVLMKPPVGPSVRPPTKAPTTPRASRASLAELNPARNSNADSPSL